ncbi:AfsR/SARP family transcriptional regulator [Saccharothrix syringae]|uniref:AfsR/SARP family transcriptional regulator n=1 Tax=Saccharothrix syringae TaxID=103733 RepID=UPI0014770B19|nr:AfsR/SARP family transcriptional regulator [Saccharothrix syringae]
MRYEVLGPSPLVRAHGVVGALPTRKAQVLLAALLIRHDQVVSTDELITEIWGGSPPRRVTAALHVHVSRLRKVLADLGADNAVVTRNTGYLLALGDDELDVLELLGLLDRARALARADAHEDVVGHVGRALALCPGQPLGEVSGGPVVTRFADWAETLRLECVGLAATANLALHRNDEVICALHPVVAENPMHEAFAAQLMRALHRAHRRAEALKVYERTRAALWAEMRLQPCWSLRELRDAIQHARLDPDPVPADPDPAYGDGQPRSSPAPYAATSSDCSRFNRGSHADS